MQFSFLIFDICVKLVLNVVTKTNVIHRISSFRTTKEELHYLTIKIKLELVKSFDFIFFSLMFEVLINMVTHIWSNYI